MNTTAEEKENTRLELVKTAKRLKLHSDIKNISEIRYRRLFEAAQDGILLVDFKTGMILDVNKFLIDLLGYSKDEFLGKHLWEVGCFRGIVASKDNFTTLQEKGFVRFEDLPLETKQGKEVEVEFVSNAYEAGGTTIIQCNIRDISLRKVLANRLALSDENLMTDGEEGNLDSEFKLLAKFLGGIMLIMGLVSLSGWIFDIDLLRTLFVSNIEIKANAAVCLALLGLALNVYLWMKPGDVLRKVLVPICTIIVFLFASEAIYEYLSGNYISWIATMFFSASENSREVTPAQGLMALNAAIFFWLASVELFLFQVGKRWVENIAQGLSILVCYMGLASLMGNSYGANPIFFGVHLSTAMAMGVSISAILFGLSTFFSSSGSLVNTFTSRSFGGELVRNVLPFIFFVPFVLGWLKLYLVAEGAISNEVSVMLVALSNATLLSAIVFAVSRKLNMNDHRRNVLVKRLQSSEDQYRSLFTNMSNGFAYHRIVVDGKGKPIDYEFLEINSAFEKMTGIVAADVLGKRVTEALPGIEKDAANWISVYGEVAITGKPIIFENYSERLKKWFNISAYSSKRGFFATVFEDISERKRVEEKIGREQELSKTIIDSIPGTFYILDGKGSYWRWNAYQRDEIVGKPENQVSSTNAIDTIHPDDRALIGAKIGNVLKTGKTEIVEGRVLMRGGPAYKWFVMTGRRMMVGDEPYLIGTGIDITQQKENEERLKELDRLKDDFLSVTTHELKTPLIPIKSQAQMLLAGDYGKLVPEQIKAIEMIYRNEEALNMLTSEVLDIAKIKSKKLKLTLEKVELDDIISTSVNELKHMAEERKVSLFALPLPELPVLEVDKLRIKQVFNNLLMNAIKFTLESGSVNVGVEKKENEVVVSVADTGIGISSSDFDKLFIPFSQIDSSLSRKYRGTGLGLAICKGIVEAHGGKIWVESEGEGRGSTFSFSLPIKNVE